MAVTFICVAEVLFQGALGFGIGRGFKMSSTVSHVSRPWAHPSPDTSRSAISASIDSIRGDDVPIFGPEWARLRGMEPGFGGLWPGTTIDNAT